MRKDIQAINEAYIKATRGIIKESFNEAEVLKALQKFDSSAQEQGAYGNLSFKKFIEFLRNNQDDIEHAVNELSYHYSGDDGIEANIDAELKDLQSDLEHILGNKTEDEELPDNRGMKAQPKLYFNDTELNVGDLVTDEMGVEEGIIVGIRYPEVYVKEFNTNDYTEGEEGWTVSEENDNMGSLVWR